MDLWPACYPQVLRINNRQQSLPEGLNVNDSSILQVEVIPERNILLMLTATRVLVYNSKPLALIASHDRSTASLNDFGLNTFLTTSKKLTTPISGLVNYDTNFYTLHNGKIIFYIVTKKNYLFTYQIIRQTNSVTIFREYGVPVINYKRLPSNENENNYLNMPDDDTLTIYDKKKKVSKVIQNGYTATRENGFLQFLSFNEDNSIEMPIKSLALRLNVILKFDYPIIDIKAFKRLSEVDDEIFEESLLILFSHGLQILNLEDFKLKTSTAIKIEHSKFLQVFGNHVYVLSKNTTNNMINLNKIDMTTKKFETITIESKFDTLLSIKQCDDMLTLIKKDCIEYVDFKEGNVVFQWNPQFEVKLGGKLNDNLLILISNNNSIYVYSKFGNQLFTTAVDDDDTDPSLQYNITDFTSLADNLVLVSSSGDYLFWNFWRQCPKTDLNLRVPQSYIMSNSSNDIAIYSSLGDSTTNNDVFQIIKLPSRTINNYVSTVRISPSMKLLAVCIQNKDVLALQNIETTEWVIFTDLHILDMKWLGSTHLLCHIKTQSETEILKCYHFPMQGLRADDLEEYSIWEYDIPASLKTYNVFINTFSKYKQMKVRYKSQEENVKSSLEKLYRTAEIILVTENELMVFDVISRLHLSGLNIIKKIQKYTSVNISNIDVNPNLIHSISSYNNSFLMHVGSKICKIYPEQPGNDRKNKIDYRKGVLLDQIETLLDIYLDDVYLIQGKKFIVINIDKLWNNGTPHIQLNIENNSYPISVSPETATLHSLHCVFTSKALTRLKIRHEIFLDQVIIAKLEDEASSTGCITNELRTLKHYNFSLEKILSYKIIEGEPLNKILELVRMTDYVNPEDFESFTTSHSNMLKIVSNCLRKIEIKYWNKLFIALGMTPRELLTMCIESNEINILGVLLLVFLNYNGNDLMQEPSFNTGSNDSISSVNNNSKQDIIEEEEPEDKNGSNLSLNNRITIGDSNTESNSSLASSFVPESSVSSVNNILQDEELLLKVLQLLVTGASATRDLDKATETWDMCFQLVRFLRALDTENNTTLVEKAFQMLA